MRPNIQCDEVSPGRTGCQLQVGHETPHAALVRPGEDRVLRRWRTGQRTWDTAFSSIEAAGLPWAPGCPTLAETTQRVGLRVVGSDASATTAKERRAGRRIA